MELDIRLDNLGSKFHIARHTMFKHKASKFDELDAAVSHIVRESFPHRVAPYRKALDESGYFEYSGGKFHLNGIIQVNDVRHNILAAYKLELDHGEDFYRSNSDSWFRVYMEKPRLFRSSEGVSIKVSWNRDVFYSLLKAVYGITVSHGYLNINKANMRKVIESHQR